MSAKAKLMYEAMDEIYKEFGKRGIPMDLIKDLLSKMYDAGSIETPDQDAARWRMFVNHFGDMRARQVRNVAFFPKYPARFIPEPDATEYFVSHGAEWRLDCVWTERTGSADTIPKFIDLMLATHRNEENE